MPRPDYPKTMREFRQKYATKAACVEYLIQCRWPDGFVCPRCSGNSGTRISSRPLFQCRNCRYQASVTAGTVMHRSKIPIQDWFVAAYHVTTFTPGLSALQLQRQLGISSHDTAWYLLHRLRKGMVSDGVRCFLGSSKWMRVLLAVPRKVRKVVELLRPNTRAWLSAQ